MDKDTFIKAKHINENIEAYKEEIANLYAILSNQNAIFYLTDQDGDLELVLPKEQANKVLEEEIKKKKEELEEWEVKFEEL